MDSSIGEGLSTVLVGRITSLWEFDWGGLCFIRTLMVTFGLPG